MQSQHDEIWLTANAAADLCKKSKVWLHECRKRGEYTWRQTTGRGGLQWEVLLRSLPADAQLRYHAATLSLQTVTTTDDGIADIESKLYAEAPEYNRRKADKYRTLLNETENLRGSALKSYIEKWNAQNPDSATSYRSLMRIRSEYAERGIDALLGGYGKTRNRTLSIEQAGEFGELCANYFKGVYCTQSAVTQQQAWHSTRGYGLELYAKLNQGDISDFDAVFPSATTFMRNLERTMGESAIFLARYGWDAWNRTYGNFVNRDYSAVRSGEVWVSDHHQLDIMCVAKDGTYKRPWLTAWMCMKSHRFIAWQLAVSTPNSDRIINTFADGVADVGIPKEVLIDNGKDYRAYDFAGGRKSVRIEFDINRATSITGQLGVNIHFALPYNAQTKPIERMFRFFTEWLAKRTPGYVGRNTVERPADQLERQMERGEILKFDEVAELLQWFILNVYNVRPSMGKNHQGLSPQQLWEKEYPGLPRVRPDALALLRTRVSGERSIGRNGIKESEADDYYWGEWMEPAKGRKVYIRRSPSAWQNCYVFDARTDEYLGMGTLGAWSSPAMARTDLERSTVTAANRRKAQSLRATRAMLNTVQTPDVQEQLRHLATSLEHGAADTPEQSVRSENRMRLTAMDDIVNMEREYRATGTGDISNIVPQGEPARRIRLWEE
ncbi:MAG: DDE-type integrase/transposase/recombinase [Candidatus Kapabacteria bacterium]|nr:DDE-type integrase/transposase/recombinase [Candidatus Kapabacteria bacterium]